MFYINVHETYSLNSVDMRFNNKRSVNLCDVENVHPIILWNNCSMVIRLRLIDLLLYGTSAQKGY